MTCSSFCVVLTAICSLRSFQKCLELIIFFELYMARLLQSRDIRAAIKYGMRYWQNHCDMLHSVCPPKCSMYTRPIPSLRAGSGNKNNTILAYRLQVHTQVAYSPLREIHPPSTHTSSILPPLHEIHP